jgi:hypothetical protein
MAFAQRMSQSFAAYTMSHVLDPYRDVIFCQEIGDCPVTIFDAGKEDVI